MTLGGDDNSYNGEIIDIGRDIFNVVFQNSEYHIIKRECATCIDGYKEIYYRRISNPDTFGVYDYMKSWREDINNRIELDFNLCTSIQDALEMGNNCWGYCDDDQGTKGAFSACGSGKWIRDTCSYPLDAYGQHYDPNDTCNKRVKFSIFVGDPSYYGVNDAQNAFVNDRQTIDDTDGDNGYEGEDNEGHAGCSYTNIVINADNLDLIMISLIGLVLIIMNGVFIGFKCGCCQCNKSCPCSGGNKYRLTTVIDKYNDNDKYDTEDHEVELEQIEETK